MIDSVLEFTPRVRVAKAADEQEVIRLLLLSHAENGVQDADNMKVLGYVKRYLYPHLIPPNDWGPRGVFGVVGPIGGELQAIIMLSIGCYWYTSEKHLEEYLVFVDPNYRASKVRYGQLLIDWAKTQADKTRMKLFTGIMSNSRTEAKVRLYRRKLTPIGAYFMYNGDPEQPDFYSDLLTGPPAGQQRLVQSSSAATAVG